jgi:glyoxylase-like metal-dependent hydrolase (beta-lactamase superfamily II)
MIGPAQRVEWVTRIAPYTEHWFLADERIGGAQSDSYALHTRYGLVFIDPLPLTYATAHRYPIVTAALLTRGCHQRASWRYRYEHAARVLAPRGSWGLAAEPDQHYVEGTRLPDGIRAIRTLGPEWDHYSLYRPGKPSILFVGDLVTRFDASSPLELSADHPRLVSGISRQSLESLLELDFDLLCLSHGGYIDDDPKSALRELLERTA